MAGAASTAAATNSAAMMPPLFTPSSTSPSLKQAARNAAKPPAPNIDTLNFAMVSSNVVKCLLDGVSDFHPQLLGKSLKLAKRDGFGVFHPPLQAAQAHAAACRKL